MRSPLAIAAALAVVLGAARAGAQWTDQTLEAIPEFVLSESAVQVDAAGRPHVFVGGDRVYHYWLDGGVWQSEIVDPAPRSGERLRAATGPSGEFHLVYVRSTPGPGDPADAVTYAPTKELRYATNLSGSWISESLPEPNDPPDFPGMPNTFGAAGLAVDASHSPHVLLGRNFYGVYHGVRSAGQWSFERLDTAAGFGFGMVSSDYGSSSELAVDPAGRVHALWFPADSSGRVVYSLRSGPGWTHEVLGQPATFAAEPSAVLVDALGTAHVLLVRTPSPAGGPALVHLTRALGGAWSSEDLAGAQRMSAALDSLGRVHLLALRRDASGSYEEIHSLAQGPSGWVDETVLDGQPYDTRISLGLDAAGAPHGATLPLQSPLVGSVLLHLRRDSAWSAEEVASSGPIAFPGNFERISDDATFGADVRIGLVGHQRRLLYRNGGITRHASFGRVVRHAIEGASGFAFETLPFTRFVPFADARSLGLAVTPDGSERAVWIDGSLAESVRSPDGDWSTSLLSALATNARRPAATFDSNGAFHVFYPSWSRNGVALVHTADDAGAIESDVLGLVQDGLPTSGSLAISPGPLGSVQVAWVDDLGAVREGTNASGEWLDKVVGNVAAIGSHSLAVEPDGTVHLAYEDRAFLHPALMYGTNRCPPGWYVSEVDPTSVPGDSPYVAYGSRNPEITLDPIGNPHIAYRRVADRSLDYARIHQGVWAHETVVADTTSGENTAIAVDDARVVSIAHHDYWAGDLRLATRAPVEPEPRWDGCPPLPDPNAVLSGRFILDPPASTSLAYDATESVDATYGAMTAHFSVSPLTMTGWLDASGSADVNGDSVTDADIEGIGKLFQKRTELRVYEDLRLTDLDSLAPPTFNLDILRAEFIDRASLQRVVAEEVRGKVDGQKVKLERVTQDAVPLASFAMRLELDIAPGARDKLAVSGVWVLRSGERMYLAGTGKWSAATHTAALRLHGTDSPFLLTLGGVRLWRTRSDGTHLRADTLTGHALGQKLKADLTGLY